MNSVQRGDLRNILVLAVKNLKSAPALSSIASTREFLIRVFNENNVLEYASHNLIYYSRVLLDLLSKRFSMHAFAADYARLARSKTVSKIQIVNEFKEEILNGMFNATGVVLQAGRDIPFGKKNRHRAKKLYSFLAMRFKQVGLIERSNQAFYRRKLWSAFVRRRKLDFRKQRRACAKWKNRFMKINVNLSEEEIYGKALFAFRRSASKGKLRRIVRWDVLSATDWMLKWLHRRCLTLKNCRSVVAEWWRNERAKYELEMASDASSLMISTFNCNGVHDCLSDLLINGNSDILLLSETRHRANVEPALPKGFSAEWVATNNADIASGGIGIVCNDKFLLNRLEIGCGENNSSPKLVDSNSFYWLFCSISIGNSSLIFGSVYRPPSVKWNDRIDVLLQQSSDLSNQHCLSVVLGGDFNIDLIAAMGGQCRPQDRNLFNCWLSAVDRCDAEIKVVGAKSVQGKYLSTRLNGLATIDFFVIVTNRQVVSMSNSMIHLVDLELFEGGSDHFGVQASCVGDGIEYFWKRALFSSSNDQDAFNQLARVHWKRLDGLKEGFAVDIGNWFHDLADVAKSNLSLNDFKNKLNESGEQLLGFLKSKRADSNSNKCDDDPWINDYIRNLLKQSKCLSRRIQRIHLSNGVAADDLRQEKRSIQQNITKSIRNAKAEYYSNKSKKWSLSDMNSMRDAFRVLSILAKGRDCRRKSRACLLNVGGQNIVEAWTKVMGEKAIYDDQCVDFRYILELFDDVLMKTNDGFDDPDDVLIELDDEVLLTDLKNDLDFMLMNRVVVVDDDWLDDFVNADDVSRALKKLKAHKSAGIDGIPYEAFKCLLANDKAIDCLLMVCKNAIKNPLNALNDLKQSRVCLLPKKPQPSVLDFRPISLLPASFKVLESILLERLSPSLAACNHGLLDDESGCVDIEWASERTIGSNSPFVDAHQAGFVGGRSCEQQAFLLQRIREVSRNKAKPLIAVFLDLKKAYDSVPVMRLMAILGKSDRVPKQLLPLIYCLLSNHERLLDLPDVALTEAKISVQRGVPQGSVLAPLLFNIFVDTLSQEIANCAKVKQVEQCELIHGLNVKMNDVEYSNVDGVNVSHLLFADDIVLLSHNLEDMQSLLDAAEHWSMSSGMRFAPQKSKALILEARDKTVANRLIKRGLKFCSQPIEFVESFKYLGVWIQSRVSMMIQHDVNRIAKCDEVANMSRFALNARKGVPADVGVSVVTACIVPSLLFGCVVQPISFELVEKKLMLAIRSVLDIHRQSSRTSICEFIGIDVRLLVAKRVASFIDNCISSRYDFVRETMWQTFDSIESDDSISKQTSLRLMTWPVMASRVLAPWIVRGVSERVKCITEVPVEDTRVAFNLLCRLIATRLDNSELDSKTSIKSLVEEGAKAKQRQFVRHSVFNFVPTKTHIWYRFAMPSLSPIVRAKDVVPLCELCDNNMSHHTSDGASVLLYCDNEIIVEARRRFVDRGEKDAISKKAFETAMHWLRNRSLLRGLSAREVNGRTKEEREKVLKQTHGLMSQFMEEVYEEVVKPWLKTFVEK
jgi:hypothetical protein